MENENTLAMQNDGIRSVAAGRGVEWLVGGFKIVFKTPGFWILGGLIVLIASVVANFIPLIGGPLGTAIYVVASGAAMHACAAIEAGRDPVQDAQKALSDSSILVLAAIAGALTLVLTLVMGAMALTSVGAGMVIGTGVGIGMGLISALLMLIAFLALYTALWLAPALVVFKNMPAIDAMKVSLKATLKNLVAYIVFAILLIVAYFIGAIPMMLGLLIVLPAAIAATYLAYQEMLA